MQTRAWLYNLGQVTKFDSAPYFGPRISMVLSSLRFYGSMIPLFEMGHSVDFLVSRRELTS